MKVERTHEELWRWKKSMTFCRNVTNIMLRHIDKVIKNESFTECSKNKIQRRLKSIEGHLWDAFGNNEKEQLYRKLNECKELIGALDDKARKD